MNVRITDECALAFFRYPYANGVTTMLFFLLSESDITKFICGDYFNIPVSKRTQFDSYEAAQKARKADAKHHLKILKLLRNGSYSIIDR